MCVGCVQVKCIEQPSTLYHTILPKDIDINIMGPEIDIEIFNKAIKKWRV